MTTPPGRLSRNPSLADKLAEQLRLEIVEGTWAAGRQLPTEAQVAESYGVSRPTVREAIGRLKHDGLIITRQGAGAFVAGDADVSAFRLDTPNFADRQDLDHVIEFLMGFEVAATALAAERRSEAQLETLREHLRKMASAMAAGQSGADDDVGFHQTIVEASGNTLFRDFARFLDARVRAFIRAARANTAMLAPEMAAAVQIEHQRIFEAIERGDAVAARVAAEMHLKGAAERLSNYLG